MAEVKTWYGIVSIISFLTGLFSLWIAQHAGAGRLTTVFCVISGIAWLVYSVVNLIFFDLTEE